MTDTITTPTTETLGAKPTVIVGQTWQRAGHNFRHLVLAVVEPEEGAPHVLHRYAREEAGADLSCTPLGEFVEMYEDPLWAQPERTDTTSYVPVVHTPAGLDFDDDLESLAIARWTLANIAAALPEGSSPVGILRRRTVVTSEWVTADELAVDAAERGE